MSARELSHWECSTSCRCERENLSSIGSRKGRDHHSRLTKARERRQRQALGKILSASVPSQKPQSSTASSNGAASPAAPATDSQSLCSVFGSTAVTACTDFVAETLLPTSSGHYRLRGYRHTIEFVSACRDLMISSVFLQTPPSHITQAYWVRESRQLLPVFYISLSFDR